MRIPVLVCALLLCVVSMTYAEWSGADGDQYISSFTPINQAVYATSAAAGPAGQLYAAWVQRWYSGGYHYEILFSKSTDGGQVWSGTSADQQISASLGAGVYNLGIFGARRTDIAVDSQNRIFVVWPEEIDGNVEIIMVMSTDGGTSWIHSDIDYPISFIGSVETANNPVIIADNNDNIHAIWNQTSTAGSAEIHYSKSTDNGATWSGTSADKYISFPDGNPGSMPAIAVDNSNNLHVVWRENNDGAGWTIHYGVSTDGGITFSSESADSVISSVYAGTIEYPRVAVYSPNDIHVVCANADNVEYVGTTDGGATWNNNTVYVGTGYDFYTPDIAVTSEGNLIALLDEEAPGTDDRQIYASYSLDGGLTWSVEVDPVTNNDGNTSDRAYIPDIVVTDGDTLHVVYLTNYPSSSNSYQEVGYSRSDTLATEGGGEPGCDYTIGDVNGSNTYNGLDITYGVSYFKGGTAPTFECDCPPHGVWFVSGDVNGSCSYNGLDITYGVTYFKGGATPVPCPACPPTN